MLLYFTMIRYFKIKYAGRTYDMFLRSRGEETPEALPQEVWPYKSWEEGVWLYSQWSDW